MSLRIKIIQPHRIVLETECDHVIIPGLDGDLGVYPGHTPLLTSIRPGCMSIYKGNSALTYAIHDGFVTIEKDVIRIACEIIESMDEIDHKRANNAKQRAETRLKSTEPDIDFRRAESSLRRAIARLQALKE